MQMAFDVVFMKYMLFSSVLYEYNVKIIRYNINCSDFSNSNLHVVEHFQSVTLPGIYIRVRVLIVHVL